MENKINMKNAFNLEIIDFMTYMIKKQDDNMSNLQVASTSLDVSTKVYGYRVDDVYTEIMKLVGGMDKQEKEFVRSGSQDDTDVQVNQVNGSDEQGKKKKKKSKQTIFSTVKNLKGSVEIMKPTLWLMGDDDWQTTDALYQVMLPNHANSKFYLHLYNDVIVDTVKTEENDKNGEENIPNVDFSGSEICPPLAKFQFLYWTDVNEEEQEEDQVEENNGNKFQFDLDASLQSENEMVDSSINLFNIEVEDNVEAYVKVQKPVEKIVDLCKIITNTELTKKSEYSFLQTGNNIHWAGPCHWKVNNFKKHIGGSKIIETCHQEQGVKRKEIELSFDDNVKQAVMAKFVLNRTGRIELKSAEREWYEETLPRDMHYNISSTTKLYLYELTAMGTQNRNDLNVTHVFDDIDNYNYTNDNDVSNYCPNIPNEDYELPEENHNEDAIDLRFEGEIHENFIGDNLVAVPKLTNKISIAYSVRANKIDMRQLKKSIWNRLITTNDKETINTQNMVEQETENKMKEQKSFSEIYRELPNMLTKANMEALSFPISFVSLLHLANEKTLKIQSLPDMSDIIVAAN
ncbi:Condensin complex subunit 2 [Dufourea novaeangliae]|uniref:Condensin complex subunit 2 n=2 Tax=Dufourea novaeangliae TaxID=178035 RepID=A0A154PHT8_DUFNO|nr:Condensin complex subunit 2 [Dufourea novaeangliae]